MNYRYLLGASVNRMMHNVLSRRWLPPLRCVPTGWSWPYDIRRYANFQGPPTFIDGGANVGQTSRLLVRYFPLAAIHSFEPVLATYQQLQRNTARYPNVRCLHKALGAKSEKGYIRLHENSELNTLTPEAGPADFATKKADREQVDIVTLDNYSMASGLGYINILKLDVQGYEMEVLKGAQYCLEDNRIGFIYSEVTFDHGCNEMQHFGTLHTHLKKYGFALCGFYEPFRWGVGKRYLGFCNALYINTKSVDNISSPPRPGAE
jgi:FkbM family methyltransferase